MDRTSCTVSPVLWNRTMKTIGTPVLIITVRRPSFPNSGKTQRMERYFMQLAHQWQTRWETDLYQKSCQALAEHTDKETFQPWNASMDFEITLWTPPLISIRINVQEQGPDATPRSLCIGEVWDCSSGYPCSLRMFLPAKPRRWKRTLIPMLQEQIQQHLNSGLSLLYPDCVSLAVRRFDPNHFYLTEDGLVIFYPLYALGSYGEGIPTFTIPISVEVQANMLRALSITARR